ncbi:hypothetical protein [Streptomyces sp. WM6368]|uniref:hypothetical protein n=1 Tax=Streptomyces sp. WM6368 TaxID=1415554 RepID=UPI00131BC2F6|nr:hypothetical protein [Streptomyces sp. WM6368]
MQPTRWPSAAWTPPTTSVTTTITAAASARCSFYRQPTDEGQVFDVLCGASLDLYEGYNWDGDDHWTVEAVRAWWADRGRVRAWAVDIAADWGADTHPHWGSNNDPRFLGHYHDAAQGHRDFIAHIDDGLESYLRGYLFWLEQRREPRPGEALPRL